MDLQYVEGPMKADERREALRERAYRVMIDIALSEDADG